MVPKKNTNPFVSDLAHLRQEWHPTKNSNLDIEKLRIGSRTVQKSGCKACQREKNLLVKRSPEIAAEWHLTKNIGIELDDVTFGSNKVVWWQCKNGHEWRANIKGRVRFNSKCKECIRPNYRPSSKK